MHIFINWIVAMLIIFLAALFLPGVSVLHFGQAIEGAGFFGAAAVQMRSFFRYIGLPARPFTLGLFFIALFSALVFWTSALSPGFFIRGWQPALVFISILVALNTYLALHPDLAPDLSAKLVAGLRLAVHSLLYFPT